MYNYISFYLSNTIIIYIFTVHLQILTNYNLINYLTNHTSIEIYILLLKTFLKYVHTIIHQTLIVSLVKMLV